MDASWSQSSTDGRRRRLLASQESEDLLTEFEALAPQTTAAVIPNLAVTVPDRLIMYRMVSGQLWKHMLLLLAVVLVSITAVWSEIEQPDALQSLASSNQPRVGKGLAGIFLVFAGQLSLMIGWIRSRSSVDFSGQYRCWKWLAGSLVALGILWITNCQDALPQVAQVLAKPLIGGVSAARRTLVVVPIVGVSIWILSRVIPDMGRNRYAQALFGLGVLSAVGRLLLSYSTSLGTHSDPVLDSILLSSAGLMVCSLLLHTRFVLYISNDPPERSASTTARDEQATQTDTLDLSVVGGPEQTERPETSATGKAAKKPRRGKRRTRKAA
ncbi:MAG: hypothetical protein MK102_07880 [Fuerstiella sp.]|nr:hypothetical protein [Fuerstiella sp.]